MIHCTLCAGRIMDLNIYFFLYCVTKKNVLFRRNNNNLYWRRFCNVVRTTCDLYIMLNLSETKYTYVTRASYDDFPLILNEWAIL